MRYQELEGKTQLVAQDAEALNSLSREMDNIRSSYDSDRKIWITLEQSYLFFPFPSFLSLSSLLLSLPILFFSFSSPFPSFLPTPFPYRWMKQIERKNK